MAEETQPTSWTNGTAYEGLRRDSVRKVQLVVEVALDPVPGWGHTIEDHVNLMFARDPYVLGARILETPKES